MNGMDLSRPEWWLVFAAFVTLIVIAWQAVEMRRATQAMRENTDVVIKSQSPQIAADAHGNPSRTLLDHNEPRVQLDLFNRGLTPAYGVVYDSWIELLPQPFVDFTPSADHFKSTEESVLYPNHSPITVNIPIRSGLTEPQLTDLTKLRLYACVRVRVEYRDLFKRKRFADFGFYITAEGLGFLPKYNSAN